MDSKLMKENKKETKDFFSRYHFYLITAKMLHTKLFDFLRPAKKDEKLKVTVSEVTEKARINRTSDWVKNYIMCSYFFRKSC